MPTNPDIYQILEKYWGYKQFRALQEDIIMSVLGKRVEGIISRLKNRSKNVKLFFWAGECYIELVEIVDETAFIFVVDNIRKKITVPK